MAIQIGGTTVIDNSRNITNVGIITVGTGGTSGTLKVGTGVTIDGAGNAYFDGYITVNGGINYLVGLTSIYPQNNDLSNNSVYNDWDGNLFLYFDSAVAVSAGSTLKIELKKNSTSSVGIRTVGISSITYPGGDFSVLKVGFGSLSVAIASGIATYFPIIPKGIIKFSSNSSDYAGNYSGDIQQNLCSFRFEGTPLGNSYGGGNLICAAGGFGWIVAPSTTEISRNWYLRNDANTCAQTVTGCTGWFIPTDCQLQNPGYICRTYWSSYNSAANYWSSTEVFGTCTFQTFIYNYNERDLFGCPSAQTPTTVCTCCNARALLPGGPIAEINKPTTSCVRAFRCVTY